MCTSIHYGAVADAEAEGDVDAIAEAPVEAELSMSFAMSEEEDDFNCPRISPSGFWSVWTLTYALPSSISLIRSDICFPDNGPLRSAEVIVPPVEVEVVALPPPPPPAEADAKAPWTLRFATIGPFVPVLPL